MCLHARENDYFIPLKIEYKKVHAYIYWYLYGDDFSGEKAKHTNCIPLSKIKFDSSVARTFTWSYTRAKRNTHTGRNQEVCEHHKQRIP